MKSGATLLIIILIAMCGCTQAVKNTPLPSQSPPPQVSQPSLHSTASIASPVIAEDTAVDLPAPVDDVQEEEDLDTEAIEQKPTPIYGIDFDYNKQVQHWITKLTSSDRKYFEQILFRFDKIRPHMEDIFASQGLPTDLVYLSLVESGGNPNAISHAGATGYWQFMKGTARHYGLTVNTWVDERRDLEKSTLAAAAYLKHLHSLFDDWLLASAAYNAGEGTITRILKRHPDIECFWDISRDMPVKRETLAYVPKFTATLIMAKNRQKYDLCTPECTDPEGQQAYETVTVNTFTYLDEIAEVIGVSQHCLAELNPELIRGCTPPMDRNYELKVPVGTAEKVAIYLSGIDNPHVDYVTHTIGKGDTLSALAKKYSSSTKKIAQANRIKPSGILTIGKVLIIPRNTVADKPRGKHTYVVAKGDTLQSISKTKGVSVQDIIDVNNLNNPETIYPDMVLNIPPKYRGASHKRLTQYRVKKGDTIWGISKQFEVSWNDIMRWNQLSSTAQIYPGDEITIYHR